VNDVIEGEVLEGTFRRRERNAGRVVDVLPPSKDEKLAAMSRMTPAEQVDHVTEMLVHSHAGLLVALAAQDLPGIAEAKQKAATIQEIAKQLRMGKDMQLHAAEFCRRAERGLGVAIREGQERGEILRPKEAVTPRNQHSTAVTDQAKYGKPRPTDYATAGELYASRGGIYDMTDGVSDEQFEAALAEARAEAEVADNSGHYALSRANVARKAKAKAGKSKQDVSAHPSDEPVKPSEPASRQFKKDSTEMVDTINHMLQGAVQTLGYARAADVDPAQAGRLRTEISTSLLAIKRFVREMPDARNA